nr:energy transducer TonB [Sphingobium lignivorans]
MHGDKAKPPAGSVEGSAPLLTVGAPAVLVPAPLTASAPAAAPLDERKRPDEPSRLQAYQQILWAQIAAHRPRATRMAGTVRVRFQLDHGGALISCEVTKSSGLMLLDGIALRAVRQASPFPAPPEELAEDALQFEVPVTFGRERHD